MEYNNTNYSEDDNRDIEILYIIFFLSVIFLIIPQTYQYIKKSCDDEFEEEYDDVEIGPQRELKPDYSSNDDEEEKYI